MIQETANCKACGNEISPTDRFCSRCGESFLLQLDTTNMEAESFIDVYNSVYNLLCDKENLSRLKYFPPESEKILFARGEAGYQQVWTHVSFNRTALGRDPFNFDISELAMIYNSNMLSGYALRVVEDLVSKKTSHPLSTDDLNLFLRKFLSEAGSDWLDRSKYTEKSLDNPSDSRIVLIHALGWENNWKNYLKINKKDFDKHFNSLISDRVETSLKLMSNIKDWSMSERMKNGLIDEVYADILYGYYLKLSEELYPYIKY